MSNMIYTCPQTCFRKVGSSVEKEIKKYATQKPDQVADIIKSWMAEDER